MQLKLSRVVFRPYCRSKTQYVTCVDIKQKATVYPTDRLYEMLSDVLVRDCLLRSSI